ncbi:hypothetical protein BDW74DRAFT_157932 [Aspergillus multicolor]|uniref:uncharacterized protein n=1 Tax=Aspergillus multicolor TaxID=41759 RepID=UPI003CCD0F23
MAILDKDRPRGLRVPSLSSFRSKHKSPEPTPTIQLPSPSQLTLQTESIPVSSFKPVEKALPSQPLPSPPQQSFSGASNPYPSPPQTYNNPPTLVSVQNSTPTRTAGNDSPIHAPLPALPADRPMPRPIPQSTTPPARRPIPKSTTAPQPVAAPTPVYAPAPVSPVNNLVTQQRTPPLSDAEPEQRKSNDTSDSLEDLIPSPEPEPELNGTSGASNEVGSGEEDARPFTPPEVDPVAVPLNQLHYACYQDHRAMPAAGNVWYALPCMTCQKFDREIRHRCVFCCLRVCADCFQTLQKCQRRSLTQLMETISSNETATHQPSAAGP